LAFAVRSATDVGDAADPDPLGLADPPEDEHATSETLRTAAAPAASTGFDQSARDLIV
jgi:hypothetical protein